MKLSQRIKEELGDKIILWQEMNPRRFYFSINKEDLLEVATFLFKELRLRFSIASGIDTPDGFEILYHFSDDKEGIFYTVRVFLKDKKSPSIDSLTGIFSGAEWIEREMWELLGINFIGHPNLKRLLLSEDWPEGEFPLRKTKQPPQEKEG